MPKAAMMKTSASSIENLLQRFGTQPPQDEQDDRHDGHADVRGHQYARNDGGMSDRDAGTGAAKEPDQKGGKSDACDGAPARRQTIQCSEHEPGERPDEQREEQYGAGYAGYRLWVMKRIDVPGIEEGIRDGQRVEHGETGSFQE